MSNTDGGNSYTIARAVFEQTWDDYYAWAPWSYVPLDLRNIVASTDDEAQDPSLAYFKYLDEYTSTPESVPDDILPVASEAVHPSFAHRVKTTTRSSLTATLGSYSLQADPETIPQYSFVIPVSDNIFIPEEYTCGFIPILADDEPFSEEQYLAMFNGLRSSAAMNRDTTVDLISIETRRRLLAAGFDDQTIDNTRVLPERIGQVASYEIERDLPPFPEEPDGVFGEVIDEPKTKPWHLPLIVGPEEDGPEGGRPDTEELFCRNSVCKTFACNLHVRGQYSLELNDPDEFPLQRPRLPDEPCSEHCCKSERMPQGDWSRLDSAKLMVALGSGYERSCDLRHVFLNRTCSEIHHEMCKLAAKPRDLASQAAHSPRHSPRQSGPKREGCRCRYDPLRRGGTCDIKICECAQANRECDPILCETCTASEGGCRNVMLQTHQVPRLRVGISDVAGFGLFADQDIEKGRLIQGTKPVHQLLRQEYQGEVIDGVEANKRDLINTATGRNYLFELITDEACVDGANLASLSRFINDDINGGNVTSRLTGIGEDPKIAILSTRKIKRGEELYLDYGNLFHKPTAKDKIQESLHTGIKSSKKMKR